MDIMADLRDRTRAIQFLLRRRSRRIHGLIGAAEGGQLVAIMHETFKIREALTTVDTVFSRVEIYEVEASLFNKRMLMIALYNLHCSIYTMREIYHMLSDRTEIEKLRIRICLVFHQINGMDYRIKTDITKPLERPAIGKLYTSHE